MSNCSWGQWGCERVGPEQTGTMGMTYEGHRDVVDVSWAICKFFFLSIPVFLVLTFLGTYYYG